MDFSGFETVRSSASAAFLLNKNAIVGNSDRAADGFADASTQIEEAKAGLQSAINQLATANQGLKNVLQQNQYENSELTYNVGATKEALDKLKVQVEEERRLAEVRREQVASLEGKHEANYHSSWMGLFRPLKEESRTGLLVAAIVFFLLAIGGLYYGYTEGMWSVPEFLQQSLPFGHSMRGGRGTRVSGHRL